MTRDITIHHDHCCTISSRMLRVTNRTNVKRGLKEYIQFLRPINILYYYVSLICSLMPSRQLLRCYLGRKSQGSALLLSTTATCIVVVVCTSNYHTNPSMLHFFVHKFASSICSNRRKMPLCRLVHLPISSCQF